MQQNTKSKLQNVQNKSKQKRIKGEIGKRGKERMGEVGRRVMGEVWEGM